MARAERRALWLAFVVTGLLIPGGACFEQDLGSGPGYSNGVAAAPGVDWNNATTLAGDCNLDTDTGEIECDGTVRRVANYDGVWNGIGWQRRPASAQTCAGSTTPAPALAVFSFGSLIVPEGGRLQIRGNLAVALIARRRMELHGDVELGFRNGGFGTSDELLYESLGPGAGPSITNALDIQSMGAPGAGGLEAGGGGGNNGAGPAAIPPQHEPLCGGSSGGSVGHRYPNGSGVGLANGGRGGGAILLGAGESIAFVGPGCGLHASGRGGNPSGQGGGGGGAGGTISIETPLFTLDGCWITANGGGGGGSAESGACDGEGRVSLTGDQVVGGTCVDPGGMGGALAGPATAGAAGDFGGGGGGSAGFIRLRVDDCSALPATISPQPSCEEI
jgi:hypothetical protein